MITEQKKRLLDDILLNLLRVEHRIARLEFHEEGGWVYLTQRGETRKIWHYDNDITLLDLIREADKYLITNS